MTKNSPYKSYTRSLLSHFGLYKYENAEPRKATRSYYHQKFIGAYIATAMFFLMVLSICMLLLRPVSMEPDDILERVPETNRSSENPINENDDNPVTVINLPSQYLNVEHRGAVFTKSTTSTTRPPLKPPKMLRPMNVPKGFQKSTSELLLERDVPPPRIRKRVKFLHTPETWDTFKGFTVAGIRDQIPRPPRMQRVLVMRKYDDEEPRPFNYQLDGMQPSEFKKVNKTIVFPDIPKDYNGEVNNIQDILRQVRGPEFYRQGVSPFTTAAGASGVQISGRYRHPRKGGIKKIFDTMNSNGYHQNTSPTKLSSVKYVDPLNPYKPQSPSEVNLLAMNPYWNKPGMMHSQPGVNFFPESYNPDIENMYHKLIQVNNDRQKYHQNARKGYEGKKHRPFSLMLDIYPMAEDDHHHLASTQRPVKVTKPRKPYFPLPPGPSAVNNLPYSYQLENSYYNSINFPQLQHNKYSQQSGLFHNPFVQSGIGLPENTYQRGRHEGENKPSQIMVHLNLFPKKKSRHFGHENGHEENKRISNNHGQSLHVLGRVKNSGIDPLANPVMNRTVTGNGNSSERLDKPVVVVEEEIVTRDDNANRDGRVTISYPEVVNPRINPREHNPSRDDEDLVPKDSVVVTHAFQPPTELLGDFKVPEAEIIKFQYDDAVYSRSDRFAAPRYK